MRACKRCGLSIGDTATYCPVCGALADPEEAQPAAKLQPAAPRPVAPVSPVTAPAAAAPEPPPPSAQTPEPSAPASVAVTASELEVEARACEKTDAARAATLYRQAIVEHLDLGEDALGSKAARRDVQRLFDRLSLALKRVGLHDEALEEIDTAAYLGLVDDETCGTKAQREALVKRREALRRAVTKAPPDPS